MSSLRSSFIAWVPLAAGLCAMAGLVYVVMQHDLRIGANDPQIQLAADAALKIGKGASYKSILPTDTVDVGASLSPFLIVYDGSGAPLVSSGLLGDSIPVVPHGVVQFVTEHGEDRITWQPTPSVRIAAVLVRAKGGSVVLAGRSLREVEKRVDDLNVEVGSVLLLSLLGTYVLTILATLFFRKDWFVG